MVTIGMNYNVLAGKDEIFTNAVAGVIEAMQASTISTLRRVFLRLLPRNWPAPRTRPGLSILFGLKEFKGCLFSVGLKYYAPPERGGRRSTALSEAFGSHAHAGCLVMNVAVRFVINIKIVVTYMEDAGLDRRGSW